MCLGDPLETERIGQRERHEFIIALQEMQDRPRSNRNLAPLQLLMNFGHTAVLRMAQRADQGDDIEAKLVLGQCQPSFCLWPIGLLKLGTGWSDATPDFEREAPHIG
jgi:hypothetical protein